VHGSALYGRVAGAGAGAEWQTLFCHVNVARSWAHVRIVFASAAPRRPNVGIEINGRAYAATIERPPLLESVTLALGGYADPPDHAWLNVEMDTLSAVTVADAGGTFFASAGGFTAAVAPARTLLDCFCSQAVRRLARLARSCDAVVLTLRRLFRACPRAQADIECDHRFVDAVAAHPPTLQWSLTEAVSDYRLSDTLLERVVLNVWLWSRAPFAELAKILYHWANAVIQQHRAFFVRARRFMRILSELHIFFLFVDNDAEPLDSVLGYRHFNASYTPLQIAAARSQYLLFLKRVAFLSLSPADVDGLQSFCINSRFAMARLCYLKIIHDCASLLRDHADLVRLVSSLIALDEAEVAVMALLALHELVPERLHFFATVLWYSGPDAATACPFLTSSSPIFRGTRISSRW
jgi:hypothetical protein